MPRLSAVRPSRIALPRGGRLVVGLEGAGLNGLTHARLLYRGKAVRGARLTLERPKRATQARRRLTIEVPRGMVAAPHQLILYAGRRAVALPRGVTVAPAPPQPAGRRSTRQ